MYQIELYLNIPTLTDMSRTDSHGVDITAAANAFPDCKERRRESYTKPFDSILVMKDEIPKQPFAVDTTTKTKTKKELTRRKKKKESTIKLNHPPLQIKDIGMEELKDLMDAATTRMKIIEASRGQKIRDEEIVYIVKDVVDTQNPDDSMTATTEQNETPRNEAKQKSLFITDPTLKPIVVSMMTILLQRISAEKSASELGPIHNTHQTHGFPFHEVITKTPSTSISGDAFQPSINTNLSNLSHVHPRNISSTTDTTKYTFVNADDHNNPHNDSHMTMAHEDGIEHTMEELQTVVSAVNTEINEDDDNESSVLSGQTENDWDDSESEFDTENEPGPFESAVENMLWYFDSRMGLQADPEKSIQTDDGNISADEDLAEDETVSVEEHTPPSMTQAPPPTLFSAFFGTTKTCESQTSLVIDEVNNDLACISEPIHTSFHGVDFSKPISDGRISELPPVFQSISVNSDENKEDKSTNDNYDSMIGKSSLDITSEGETARGNDESTYECAGTKSVRPAPYFFGFFGSSLPIDEGQLDESMITELDESFETTLDDDDTSNTVDVEFRQTISYCAIPTDTMSSKESSFILLDTNESVKRCALESNVMDSTFQTTQAISAAEAALKPHDLTPVSTDTYSSRSFISTKIMVVSSPKSEGIKEVVPKELNDHKSAHIDDKSDVPKVITDLNDSTVAAWDRLECTSQDLESTAFEAPSLDSESTGKLFCKTPNSCEEINKENILPISSLEERTLGNDPTLIGNLTRSGDQRTSKIDQEITCLNQQSDAETTSKNKQERTKTHQHWDSEIPSKREQEQTRTHQHWDAEARRRRRRHRKPQTISTVLTSDNVISCDSQNVALQQIPQQFLVEACSTINGEDQSVREEVAAIESSTSIYNKGRFDHVFDKGKNNLLEKREGLVCEPDLLTNMFEQVEGINSSLAVHSPTAKSSTESLSLLEVHSTKGTLYGVLSSSDTLTNTELNKGEAIRTGLQVFTSNSPMQQHNENGNQYQARDAKIAKISKRGINVYMLGKAHLKRAGRKQLCQTKPEMR